MAVAVPLDFWAASRAAYDISLLHNHVTNILWLQSGLYGVEHAERAPVFLARVCNCRNCLTLIESSWHAQ